MSKKPAFRLLSAVLAAICLTGCTRQEAVEETKPEPIESRMVSVKDEVQTDGCTLVIDTTVEVPDLSTLEEITLCFDEDLLNTMVEELVHSQYPDLKEGTMDGYRTWSAENAQLLFSYSCSDTGFETGWNYYLDGLRDLNGQDMGDDGLMRWTPYYMTEHVPDKLGMTSEEAAEKLSEFLERYSCFEYQPWNVVAVNCRTVPDSSGYYQAFMQPYYDGLPVFVDGVSYVSACISAEGVFTFQGVMVLKEQSRTNAQAKLTLDQAVDQFKADFKTDIIGNYQDHTITVNRIRLGYVAESHYSGSWVLSPAWIFEYSRESLRPDNQQEVTRYDTCVYRMKDGSLYN